MNFGRPEEINPPSFYEVVEDEIQYINCDLCNDIISVDELEILTPIINQHFLEQIVCKECLKLKDDENS